MNPGDIVPLAFNAGLVGLSFVIAALGSYVALLAAARIRRPGVGSGAGTVSMGYVLVAALALGGIGIWGMHFIGMLAQRIPFVVGYDISLTILSFLVAVFFAGAALWYVGHGRYGTQRCLAGGVLAGVGVAGMHYIGMSAMRMPAIFSWSEPLVVASVVIAVAAASAALWLAFSVQREWHRVVAALVMAGAVCGMHYTGAAAGSIICTTPTTTQASWLLGGASLPYVVFVLSALTLVVMRWLLHRTSTEYREQVAARMDALLDTKSSKQGS